jgi:hypothetical protein
LPNSIFIPRSKTAKYFDACYISFASNTPQTAT